MLRKYNQAQKEAIQASDGPVLVIAGAGSGKTSVLIQHIIYLINDKERSISPDNILAVTFTNKAANEMKERLEEIKCSDSKVNDKDFSNIWIGTFHAICARILHKHINYLGFQQSYNIYDKNDSKRLIKKCISMLDIDSKQYQVKTISNIIENSKNKLIDENDFYDNAIGFYNKIISKVYKKYQEELKNNQSLDYSDLIVKTVQLFKKHPDILEYYQEKFKYILVDEYQDINHAQYILIKLLSKKRRNLFVVGDPDQSIYRFRGAELGNIISFEEDFPESTVIKLEQNYRSSENILKAASFVIKNNTYRKEKRLWTTRKGGEKIKYYEASSAFDEAEFIAREIKNIVKHKKLKWRDIALLYRTNAQSRSFEEVFAKNSIPFRLIGGIRFYDRKEIKNILYLLKIIYNPDDKECIKRWLEMDRMGIGEMGFKKINYIANHEQRIILDVLPEFIQSPGSRINENNKEKIINYLQTFNYLRKNQDKISFVIEQLIKRVEYYNLIRDDDDQIKTENKIENVKAFIQSVREYEKQNTQAKLNDFLTYVSLISGVDSLDNSDNKNAVNLMTLHCAKGLEFPVVFLTGLEEGIFPHNRSFSSQVELEEERRLCYVGMTRAIDLLYLTYTWRRNMDGKTVFNKTSRFFSEIPKRYLDKAKILSNGFNINSGYETLKRDKKELFIDDVVCHPDWGEGSIINKKETGNDCYVTVNFKFYGIKRLSLKYAPLKKVEKN